MTIPNGTTGLHHTDMRWLLDEAKGLRDELRTERERREIAEQQFREIEDKLERNGHE